MRVETRFAAIKDKDQPGLREGAQPPKRGVNKHNTIRVVNKAGAWMPLPFLFPIRNAGPPWAQKGSPAGRAKILVLNGFHFHNLFTLTTYSDYLFIPSEETWSFGPG